MHEFSSDYQIVDDDSWEDVVSGKPIKKERIREKEPKILKSKQLQGRDLLLEKYKVLQVQMQDRAGNCFIMKKRVM